MYNPKLFTSAELGARTKEQTGQTFPTPNDAFVDAFLYGEYHEDYPDWSMIGALLSDKQLAEIWISICTGLIKGSADFRSAEDVKDIAIFHDLVVKWGRGDSVSEAVLLNQLDVLNVTLITHFKGDPSGATELVRLAVILDSGVRIRCGQAHGDYAPKAQALIRASGI